MWFKLSNTTKSLSPEMELQIIPVLSVHKFGFGEPSKYASKLFCKHAKFNGFNA